MRARPVLVLVALAALFASRAAGAPQIAAQAVPCVTPLGTCLVFGLPSGATCFCGNVAGRVP